ncbi:hypothetical protein FRC12_011129 [Ceratobasidium sp. 428]|nr:hypothetical protein FRC12_011129 [Ceratobasidium sp. 428]
MSSNNSSTGTFGDNCLSLPELCNACGGPGAFRCSSCSFVWYCSTDCQVLDHQAHGELCNLFAGQSVPATSQIIEDPQVPLQLEQPIAPFHPAPLLPTPQHTGWIRIPDIQRVRAFVLPVDSPSYYDTVIELSGALSPTGAVRWAPDLSRVFGNQVSPVDVICTRGTGGGAIRFPLHFFFEVSPSVMQLSGDLKRNQCVHSLTSGAVDAWRGTIVVLKFNGARRRGYQNIEKTDLWNIKHYLSGH